MISSSQIILIGVIDVHISYNPLCILLEPPILKVCFIISPDKSRGYIGFMSVVPPLYILTCVRDNSKTLLRISFKLGTHMYLGQEKNPTLR